MTFTWTADYSIFVSEPFAPGAVVAATTDPVSIQEGIVFMGLRFTRC